MYDWWLSFGNDRILHQIVGKPQEVALQELYTVTPDCLAHLS